VFVKSKEEIKYMASVMVKKRCKDCSYEKERQLSFEKTFHRIGRSMKKKKGQNHF